MSGRTPAETTPHHVLEHTFGFSGFRPHQEEIVRAVLTGGDVFAALPTGGGKSLCYQLPALLLPGLTVVVSPLIALMQDQVQGASLTGVPAAFLNSTLDAEQARGVWERVRGGVVRLLYVSPERLALERFRARLHELPVSLFAIDEAHCISEWGHEFRPNYRALSVLRAEFADVPIAAFTATATPRVQEDVIRLLGLRAPLAVRGDFDRTEIFYRVVRKGRIAQQIAAFVRNHRGEPGIIYRATRKAVEETAAQLQHRGVAAVPYHAGLSAEERRENQERFVRDEAEVVVATIAFGMGIDKSNVRWVLHGDLPRSVEAYYQESGRAGRDGEPAEACLIYGPQDMATIRYHIDRMEVPEERERAEANLREIMRYVSSGVCRRIQLLAHFDQEHAGSCGGCDVCTDTTEAVDRSVAAQKAMSAMVRTGQRFGANHIADIVSGTETDRVLQFNHNRLPTFAVGADRPRGWWRSLIDDLEAAGLVHRTGGQKSGLALSSAGRRVLYGKTPFLVRERSERTSGAVHGATDSHIAAGTAAPVPASTHDREELFQQLRRLRTQLAREHGVPPYVVFSDKSLKEMATYLPTSEAELLHIHGVGDAKATRYGAAFLSVIREHVAGG